MKHFLLADTHFRQDTVAGVSLLQDTVDVVRQVFGEAQKVAGEKVLWLLGDVFDNNKPAPVVNAAVIELLKDALAIFERVIILLGNHDNNDSNEDALTPLERALPQLTVLRDVTTLTLNKEQWLCVPHLSRKLLYKTQALSLSYNEAALSHIREYRIKHRLADHYCVVGHLTLAGARQGVESTLLRGSVLQTDEDLFARARFGFFGHIHKPQLLSKKLYYVGSPVVVDFAERDEVKSYLVYDGDGVRRCECRVPRRWVQLDLDMTESVAVKKGKLHEDELKGSLVKLSIRTTEKTHYHVDMLLLIKKITEAGGIVAAKKIERIDEAKTTDSVAATAGGADVFAKNIAKFVDQYLKSYKDPAELLKKARSLCLSCIDVGKYNKVQQGCVVLLKAVRLQNFFSYRDETVVFDEGMTGLVGENGAGKSSLVDAIIFALTGEERGDRAGCSLNTFAEEGAVMQVELCLWVGTKKVKLIRGRKRRTPFAELYIDKGLDTAGEEAVTQRMAELLGVDYDTLVNTSFFREEFQDAFLRAKASARENFLRQYFGLDFVQDAYKAVIKAGNQLRDEYDEARTQGKLYEAEAKRYSVANLKTELLDFKTSLEKIDSQLQQHQKTLESAAKTKAKLEELPVLIKQVKDVETHIAETEALIAEKSKCCDVSKELERLAVEGDALKTKVAQQRSSLAQITETLTAAQESLAVIQQAHSECPTCRAALDEGRKREVVLSFNNQISDLRQKGDVLTQSVQKGEERLGTLRTEFRDLKARQADYDEASAYVAARLPVVEKYKAQLAALSTKVVALKELKAAQEDTGTIEAAVDTLQAKRDELISTKAQVERDLADAARLSEAVQKSKRRMRVLEVDIRVHEIAAAVLDKSGIIVSVMKTINEIIEHWSNHLLTLLADDTVHAQLSKDEKGVSVMIDWDGSAKEYIMYSGGEKTLINFAIRFGFSMALSELTGFVPSMLVLDEVLGRLDDNNRYQMVRIVNYVSEKGFKQVLLITHTGLKEYLPQVIQLRKTERGSVVVVGQEG